LPGLETSSPEAPAPVALFDALEPGYQENSAETAPESESSSGGADAVGRRRGRTSMPSWDEIVFGARTDES
jgi:hypothetical protein